MKTLTVSCLLVLGACSSSENSQPPAASVQSEVSAGGDSTAHVRKHDAPEQRVRADNQAERIETGTPAVADPHPANNTGVNERDTQAAALTPTDQKENGSDLQITQKIRQVVMADDALSFTAKNAKIITQDGHVTLRGPVKSAAERSAIAEHANRFASGHVDNQLEIEQ